MDNITYYYYELNINLYLTNCILCIDLSFGFKLCVDYSEIYILHRIL